jgi:DedD protein
VKPAAPSKEVVLDAPDTTAGAPAKSTVANTAALDPNEELVTKDPQIVAKSDVKPDTKPELKPEAKPETKPESKTETKAETKPDAKEAAKAKALLDGKEAPKSADAPVRSVVQVGAFADLAKAREVRTKLESAGIKTYTQDVETKDGKRTRVRVGPFATKEEADKAAEKIRKLNLQATVLKL